MKPDTQSQIPRIEAMPSLPRPNIESGGNIDSSERRTGAVIERAEQGLEQKVIPIDFAAITAQPTPVADDTAVQTTTATLDAPIIASDDDLIEQEWVKKAKKIVTETKDDPHQREEKIVDLQVDYLDKRFGRKLGKAA